MNNDIIWRENAMFRRVFCPAALALSALFAKHAMAQNIAGTLPDGCQALDNNEAWTKEFTELTSNYKAKEYKAALKNADQLNSICDRSPILNFSIGRLYREMGDDTKGLYYMQRATMFTEEFQVKGELLERMWYERYEIEHVDAREESIAARKKQIEDQQAEIEQLRESVQTHERQNLEQTAQASLERNTALLNERSHYAAGLWSGVSIGGLGVVLAVTGGIMMYKNKDDAVKFADAERKGWPKDSTYLYTGLFAAGLGMTIAGTIVSGIMGYHYARTPIPDTDLDIAIGPTAASLSLVF